MTEALELSIDDMMSSLRNEIIALIKLQTVLRKLQSAEIRNAAAGIMHDHLRSI